MLVVSNVANSRTASSGPFSRVDGLADEGDDYGPAPQRLLSKDPAIPSVGIIRMRIIPFSQKIRDSSSNLRRSYHCFHLKP